MSTSFEVYPSSRIDLTFGEVFAEVEKHLQAYLARLGINEPFAFDVYVMLEDKPGYGYQPKPGDYFVWRDGEEYLWIGINGVDGSCYGYYSPIKDETRTEAVAADKADEDPPFSITVIDSSTGEVTKGWDDVSSKFLSEGDKSEQAGDALPIAEEEDCWFELHALCYGMDLGPELETRIENAKKWNRRWSFVRSGGQPPIIHLIYGIVAGVVARLTDGLINSDDVEVGDLKFPTTGDDVLSQYLNPGSGVDGHRWEEWCGSEPYCDYVSEAEFRMGAILKREADAEGHSFEGTTGKTDRKPEDSAVSALMWGNVLRPRE